MNRLTVLPALLAAGWAVQEPESDPGQTLQDMQRRVTEARREFEEFKARQDGPPGALREALAERVRAATRGLRDDLLRRLEEEVARAAPAAPAPQQDPIDAVVDRVTEESIREIVTALAADEMEGRGSGYPGNDKATEFIAGIYARAGLEPVGDAGTYFQRFTNRNGLETRNTVAALKGSDLKEEVVVIGGHHDHLGRGRQAPGGQALGRPQGDDDIWNGADDNASGSSTVVALARAFAEAGVRPRRTILFMTFSGEEWGLIGSRHYCAHPIFPLDKTIAMVNLDMVGRNPDRAVEIRGLGTAEGDVFESAARRAAESTGLDAQFVASPSISGGTSDHASFIDAGVPSMFFFTGLHPDYHKVSDHVDRLAMGRIAKIGRTAGRILWELANRPDRPRAVAGGRRSPDFRFPRERPAPDPPRTLGVVPDSSFEPMDMDLLGLAADQGGIQVSSVSPDSAAGRAGIKERDVIVSFAGGTFPRPQQAALEQLRERIAKARAGAPVELTVLRDGERVPLRVQWDR